MEWVQFILMLITFVGLFIWNRTESRADYRHTDAKIEAIRQLIHEMHKDSMEERREFHSKLCELESRKK
jgi:hypothetical protein